MFINDNMKVVLSSVYDSRTELESYYYFAPGRSTKYCDELVCMSVCLSVCPLTYLKDHLSKLYENFYTSNCGRGSVLL